MFSAYTKRKGVLKNVYNPTFDIAFNQAYASKQWRDVALGQDIGYNNSRHWRKTRILNQSDRGHTSARQEQPDMIDVNIGTQQQQPRNANGERIDEDLVLTMAQI